LRPENLPAIFKNKKGETMKVTKAALAVLILAVFFGILCFVVQSVLGMMLAILFVLVAIFMAIVDTAG
jgi:hypothetical protein